MTTAGQHYAYSGIRYRADTGWELRCESCVRKAIASPYWPLTMEFWNPNQGMTRCRACWSERRRKRGYQMTAAQLSRANAYKREWAARRRAQQRAAEGRRRYERRRAA